LVHSLYVALQIHVLLPLRATALPTVSVKRRKYITRRDMARSPVDNIGGDRREQPRARPGAHDAEIESLKHRAGSTF
jgi:hypothetical protein